MNENTSKNSTVKAYLSLGSNSGEREVVLKKALDSIGALPYTTMEAVSDIIETEAQGLWDSKSRNAADPLIGKGSPFLNCCCRIETSLEPEALLDRLQAIEISLGRPAHKAVFDSSGRRVYSDRTIDIDILLYGVLELSTARLQIPHPRMRERDFVMRPLRQILSGAEKL